jgi:hypothetical protein
MSLRANLQPSRWPEPSGTPFTPSTAVGVKGIFCSSCLLYRRGRA